MSTSPIANLILEQSVQVAKQAVTKETLTPDEEFALLVVAGVPMRTIRNGHKLRLQTNPCALARIDGKWKVIQQG